MKVNDWWLKLGCFLTGYNYRILSNCSEVAAKAVKRYTSALFIVCILWAFIGYSFSNRYLKLDVLGSIAGSFAFIIIIIQVERQILLAVQNNKRLYIFRGIIALMMALIGSLIIDQIIFKDDIEQEKMFLLDEKVNKVYPSKASELNKQIKELDSTIIVKEIERNKLNTDIIKNPVINIVTKSRQTTPMSVIKYDSSGKPTQSPTLIKSQNVTVSSIPNPNIEMLKSIDTQLNYLRNQKAQKDSSILTLRPRIEEEIKSKVGFLDELKVMVNVLTTSIPAFIVWLIWIIFLFGLELFILMGKAGGDISDYDVLILHQMDTHKKKIELLGKKNDAMINRS